MSFPERPAPRFGFTMTFPVEVILSLSTGYILTRDASAIHCAAEHIAGRVIATHELCSDERLSEALSRLVLLQHPQLSGAEPFAVPEGGSVAEYLPGYVLRAVAQFGAELTIEQDYLMRTESPRDSLARLVGGARVVEVRQ